jgi:lipopolysaccharide export system protein LptC
MAGEGNLHSRLVAWMKIILPLAALALLSTVFLLSRSVDPTKEPIVDIDLEQRAQEQGATRPRFSGVTNAGDRVTFVAENARPDRIDPDRLFARDILAEIGLRQGNEFTIRANTADMHQRNLTATVSGDVSVTTTDGYHLLTDELTFNFDTLFAETPGPVEGFGPPGQITAGKMRLSQTADGEGAELFFTDGVKLVYKPEKPEE